jgi:aspartate aminotransferase
MPTATIKINRRVKTLVGSSTLAITARAKELSAQGADVVNFAAGEPDFDTPQEIKQAAIKAIEKGMTKYTPSVGTIELREAICRKLKEDNSLEYRSRDVVVSCGAKHSLFNVIQVLADEGDEVLIPAPYWVSYPEMVKMAGAISKFLPTTAKACFKITADQLAKAITPQTRILILNSPSNPTGVIYNKEELAAIADICVANDIFVISDEIYEKLIYEAEGCVSIASLGREIFERTITVNGVSKAYSMTGWRIGYAAGPQEVMGYVNKLQDHSTSNPTSISQAAALCALQTTDESVRAMRDEFKRRRDLMMSAMDDIPQIPYIRPDGAFYLFCDFSRLGDSAHVAQRILDEMKVAVIPGDSFGAPGFIRLSFTTSVERIKEGIHRIAEWVKKQHP